MEQRRAGPQVVGNILDIADSQTGQKAPAVDSSRSLIELASMMDTRT